MSVCGYLNYKKKNLIRLIQQQENTLIQEHLRLFIFFVRKLRAL